MAAFNYAPNPIMQSAPQTQAPANSSTPVMNLAFFPFKTRDGSAPKPGSPALSGSVQFSHQQIAALYQWSLTQQPDDYGKVRIGASLWQDVAQTTGQTYWKGNAKVPVAAQQGATPQALQQVQGHAQAAQTNVQQQVWPQNQPMGTWNPNHPIHQPAPGPATGQPLPAWTTQQAYAQQQGSLNQQPNQSLNAAMPLQQPGNPALQPMPGAQPSVAGMQPAVAVNLQTTGNAATLAANPGMQGEIPF